MSSAHSIPQMSMQDTNLGYIPLYLPTHMLMQCRYLLLHLQSNARRTSSSSTMKVVNTSTIGDQFPIVEAYTELLSETLVPGGNCLDKTLSLNWRHWLYLKPESSRGQYLRDYKCVAVTLANIAARSNSISMIALAVQMRSYVKWLCFGSKGSEESAQPNGD